MLPKIVLPREGLQRKELDVDSDSESSLDSSSSKDIPSTAHKKLVTPQSRLHVKLPPISKDNQLSAREKGGPSLIKSSRVVRSRPVSRGGQRIKTNTKLSSSESDSDTESSSSEVLAEDPKLHFEEKLPEDVRDLFHFVTKYTPIYIHLKNLYKPYIPTYTPAVGDVEGFLKIIPPDSEDILSDEIENIQDLGKKVLDEPASSQTDCEFLRLQLRIFGYQASEDDIIKKVEGRPKGNCKIINKWITDISSIHEINSKSLLTSSKEMPDARELITDWPEKMKKIERERGMPDPELQCSLEEYIEFMCSFFDIPVYESKIKSLHLLFSLYAALKETVKCEIDEDFELPNLTRPLRSTKKAFHFKTTFSEYLQKTLSNPYSHPISKDKPRYRTLKKCPLVMDC